MKGQGRVNCEHLTELLSMLAAKEENHLKLILMKEVEEEVPMDGLEAGIVKMVDYHHVILSLESQCNKDD